MLKRLYLNNCFTHQDRTFTFEKGLTGVVGRNESGKSLIVEMIRYALFGSKALRGKADDYKKLHVELDFAIGDREFTVTRKGTKAHLVEHADEPQQAEGTKPVNEAIKTLLGYDLTVFDVANVCNQGDIEALSDMRPAERKAMVDQTIGLDQLDGLISYCGEEGNAIKREAMALESGLAEPAEPEMPEGYSPAAGIVDRLKEARVTRDEWLELKSFLDNMPEEPEAPAPCPIKETSDDLKVHEATRRDLTNKRDQHERELAGITPEVYSAETLDAMIQRIDMAEERRRLEERLAKITPEVHSADDLDEFEAWMDKADRWKRKQKLLAEGHHKCPSCGHQWPVADLGDLEDVEETQGPSMTREDLRRYRALIGNDALIADLQSQIDEIDDLGPAELTRSEVQEHRARLGNDAHRAHLKTVIDELDKELDGLRDRSADLDLRQVYEAQLAAYNRQRVAFDQYNAGLAEKRARFEELVGDDWTSIVQTLEKQLDEARAYERDMARFNTDWEAYEAGCDKVATKRAESDEWLTARERIKELKVSMKGHLLPSLNKVSSLLLARMTGGERNVIEIGEDFDINVDGQSIQTLSGSGKAVANLAIRIALGQILTNRVFSVFMADEVDAAMDDTRAAYTAQALQRLKETIGQVILVSHKTPETDWMIDLTQ